MKKKVFFLNQLLKAIDLQVILDKKKNIKIINVADLALATKNTISFFSNVNYLEQLKKTKASCVFTKEKYLNLIPKKITVPKVNWKQLFNFYLFTINKGI
mgnify:CR=1 FL=1